MDKKYIEDMAETVSIAVVASYIYSFLIGRGPKIIFPNKLVIRYRTCTEDKELPLAMGIMIGKILQIFIPFRKISNEIFAGYSQ